MLLVRMETHLWASINTSTETSQVIKQQRTEVVYPVPHLLRTKHKKSRAERGLNRKWKYIHHLLSSFCCDAFSLLFLHKIGTLGNAFFVIKF